MESEKNATMESSFKIELKQLKNKFLEFMTVVNDINALHDEFKNSLHDPNDKKTRKNMLSDVMPNTTISELDDATSNEIYKNNFTKELVSPFMDFDVHHNMTKIVDSRQNVLNARDNVFHSTMIREIDNGTVDARGNMLRNVTLNVSFSELDDATSNEIYNNNFTKELVPPFMDFDVQHNMTKIVDSRQNVLKARDNVFQSKMIREIDNGTVDARGNELRNVTPNATSSELDDARSNEIYNNFTKELGAAFMDFDVQQNLVFDDELIDSIINFNTRGNVPLSDTTNNSYNLFKDNDMLRNEKDTATLSSGFATRLAINGTDAGQNVFDARRDWGNIVFDANYQIHNDTIDARVDVYDTVDAPGSEADSATFGSSDDTTESNIVNADTITEPTLEPSNVTVTSVNNVSDDFVLPLNSMETKLQLPSENEDLPPWIMVKPHQGCDDENMFVPTSDSKDKKLCCVYCLNRYTKLARHLQTVHKIEADVKKFCDFPTGSKERRELISIIRKRGQFAWNTNAKINGGELSTSRRPNKKFQKKASDHNTCPKCFGEYRMLRTHWNRCSNNCLKGERVVKQLSRAVEGRIHPNACDDLRTKIFSKIIANAGVRLIRFDWLIIEFGNDLCLNYSPIYQLKLIRGKLRDAGRFLVAAKSISSEITEFSSIYQVKNCNVAVEAIRKISRFDLKAKRFGSPGTATTLVTLIKAIGDLLVIEKMKEDNQIEERNVERFLKVFAKDAKIKINKLAAVTQANARRGRKEDIPSTDDVCRLATYLDSERDKCFLELSQKYSHGKWEQLSELTLASILVFSRKRTGETRNILVKEFLDREIIADHRDKLVPHALPEYTSQLIKSRLIIRGKLNRPVPVLLKHSFDECIELLLHHRKDARIPDENEFLFALYAESGEIKTVNSCDVVARFSKKCAAENPRSLRGTKLRKHLASLCGTMNLTDSEVTNVAKFMGHEDDIHRNVYRHNTLQREVIQMSSILEAAQGKNINAGSPKINVTPEESSSESCKYEGVVVNTKTIAKRNNKNSGTASIKPPKKNKTKSMRKD